VTVTQTEVAKNKTSTVLTLSFLDTETSSGGGSDRGHKERDLTVLTFLDTS